MTDEELVRNLATFMLAGHETTAVALTWTLEVITPPSGMVFGICAAPWVLPEFGLPKTR